MYEKREYKIKSKIIRPEDIRRFAKVIDETRIEFVRNQSDENLNYNISFSATTTDDTSYSNDTTDIFNPEGILDSKPIKHVGMHFRSYRPNAEASVRIDDSRYCGYSNIEVEGSDSTWVNGIFNKFLDSLNSCSKQHFIGTKFKWPMSALSSVIIGFAFVGIINIILNYTSDSGNQLSYWVSLFFIGFTGIASFVFEKFWPDVEIISGNRQLQASSGLKGVVYILILPFIIAIIANLISRIII